MGLFSKSCSVCGGTGGALSSKKIADGHVCGDCIKKLSPWFDEFKKTSSSQIREQIEYREANRRALDDFEVTKAWGVKKYQVATQFAYDEAKRGFVIVEGPVEEGAAVAGSSSGETDFRDKNPDIISFDQVKDIWLEIDEYWTEGKGEFDARPLNQNLTQDKYDEVYWRYDFYLNFETTHPYAKSIRYKMNFKPTIMQVPQRGIFFRRGLGIGGVYRGEEVELLALQLEAFEAKEENIDEINRKLDVLRLRNKDKGLAESVRDGILRTAKKEIYYAKLTNMGAHVARADRISKLILGE